MLIRSLSLLAAVALFGLSSAQDLTKKIDYTTKAVTIQHALSDLSQQAGVKLFIQPDLQDEIIILRLKDVPLQDALQKIADAVGAQWKKTSDGYELDRTPEIEDKLREDAIAVRTKNYQDSLQKQLKVLQVDQPMDQARIDKMVKQLAQTETAGNPGGANMDWRALSRLQNSMPDQRALWRVLAQIDPQQIAMMEDGQRVVFSNKPTAMQRPIDADLSDVGTALKEEHNQFYEAYAAAKKDQAKEGPRYVPAPTGEMTATPVRFVVSAQKQMFSDGVAVSMLAFDADNHPVANTSGNLQFDDQFETAMANRAKVAKELTKEEDIELTPITKQMLMFMRSAESGDGQPTAATGDLKNALMHPENADPLAFALSEAFIGVAEHRNENLVMYTDDSMFFIALFAGMEGELKPSLVLQAVTGLGQIMPTNVVEQDGWLTAAPTDRLTAERTRTNRPALGVYMRQLDQNGFLSIDDMARLAMTIQGYQLPMLDYILPMMISPQIAMSMGQNDLNILKLYASFDDGQRERLDSNQPLRMSELSKDQVDLLTRFVYESTHMDRPDVYLPDRQQKDPNVAAAEAELTESAPNGLTNDATLTMHTETAKDYVVKMTMGTSTFTQSMDINTLAWYVHEKDHPDPRNAAYRPSVVSVALGEKRTITVTVVLSTGRQSIAVLTDEHQTEGGPWTLDKLPDDLKAQLAKLEKSFQQPEVPDDQDSQPPVQVAPPPVG